MLTASIGGGALGVAFRPDGRLVAAGSADGRVALWDGRTLTPVGPPTVGSGAVVPDTDYRRTCPEWPSSP